MWKYIRTREFWLAIVGIGVFFAVLFILFFWIFLPLYTRHKASVTVPDLAKLTLTEAISELDKEGLNFEVADSVFFPNLKPLAIVSQDPLGLTKVKPGRKIYLTVNKQVPPRVKVPAVQHVSLYQARVRLDNWGLSVGKVVEVPSSMNSLVLELRYQGKTIKPGEEVPSGAQIDLVVGKQVEDQNVEVPDLVGLSYTSAISVIQELGLTIGETRYNEKASDEPGTILRQDPEFHAGDSIPVGTEIILFIAGPKPEEATEVVPDTTE